MNKAALSNVPTGEFKAREAARRHGMSQVERLHDAAADHLMDVSDRHASADAASAPRADGEVAQRLSRHSCNEGHSEFAEPSMSRLGPPRRTLETDSRDRSRLDAPEMSLAKAIDAMERRTLRSKRRAGAVWEPASRPQDRYEEKRDHLFNLAERLSEVETRLTDRFVPSEENPVGATLARLEARLDSLGRHSLAEASALQRHHASRPVHQDPLYRLEEKLDSILAAVRAWPSGSSTIAFAASQAAGRGNDRDLGDAVGDIARRQKMLDDPEAEPVSLKQAVMRRAVGAHRQPPGADAPFAAMQREIAALATKIEGLSQGVAEFRKTGTPTVVDLRPLRGEIDGASQELLDLARRADLACVETSARALAEKLDDLNGDVFGSPEFQPLKAVVGDLCKAFTDIDIRKVIDGATDRLRVIGQKIDKLEHAGTNQASVDSVYLRMTGVRELIATAAAHPLAAERIEPLLQSLEEILQQAPTQSTSQDFTAAIEELRDLLTFPPGRRALSRIDVTLESLDLQLDSIVDGTEHKVSRKSGQSGQEEIETLLQDLSAKMEAVQVPSADHQSIDALQKQIALLSERFETSGDGLAKLNALQQSMQDVLANLEQTRASVEKSAAEAAREVLRIAIDDGKATSDQSSSAANLFKMQALQAEAEERTGTALSAVQETLTKVVHRLSSMETDIAEVRNVRKVEGDPKDPLPEPAGIALGAPDRLLDLVLGSEPIESIAKAQVLAKPASVALPAITNADPESDPVDFIAAARRAAKVAQKDLSVPEAKKPAVFETKGAPRELLFEQSRDYIARHKKPVLLGVAALFVIVGTLAIIERFGLGGTPSQNAVTAPRAQFAATFNPTSQSGKVQVGDNQAGTPALKASGAIAGAKQSTDPMQTASIAPLPVFAAPLAAKPLAPPPSIPVKLKSLAESGERGAEYILGTQYAEGRGTPRDFKVAAQWYQKAADQGLAPAQYRLASLYEKGLGVTQDKVKARGLYLQAAEAGNPRAMHNLAVLLADGDGKPDYGGAATWFRRAAQYGMQDSQFNLAILLARGVGVQQSLVQSYQWFAIAAAQNDPDAAAKRDEVGRKLDAADLAVAKTLAASFRPRAVTVAATEVQPPPGGWDGAASPSPLNSARHKISSL